MNRCCQLQRHLLILLTNNPSHYYYYSTASSSIEIPHLDSVRLQQCLTRMGLDDTVDEEALRKRFAELARAYHPDGGRETADAEKFQRLCSDYKFIMRAQWDNEGEEGEGKQWKEKPQQESPDIRHTAPQHRQFLEYGGVGSGTPFDRQRFYQQHRASTALETAQEYAFEKAMGQQESTSLPTINNKSRARFQLHKEVRRSQKMTGLIERTVEDMISASIAEGQFNNLKGAGKPLAEDHSNPYIDETEKRINAILKNNGFVPLWIQREAKVREGIRMGRDGLAEGYYRHVIGGGDGGRKWAEAQAQAKDTLRQLNKLIADYNLIAPSMNRQFMQLSIEREVERAIEAVGRSDFKESEIAQRVERERKRGRMDERQRGVDGGLGFREFVRNIVGSLRCQ